MFIRFSVVIVGFCRAYAFISVYLFIDWVSGRGLRSVGLWFGRRVVVFFFFDLGFSFCFFCFAFCIVFTSLINEKDNEERGVGNCFFLNKCRKICEYF